MRRIPDDRVHEVARAIRDAYEELPDGTAPELTEVHEWYGEARAALRAAGTPALDAAEARGRAEALSEAADAWQRGAWANTPRHRDRAADRVGQAQYVTEWLRERAATTAPPKGDHHA